MRSRLGQGTGYELHINHRIDGTIDHRHAHLHAQLAGVGLDLSRYSDEQLAAIEDFSGMIGEPEPAE